MKRSYTISHKVPKGINNYSPQGLKDIYKNATGSKRSKDYCIDIVAKETRDYTHFETDLETSLITAIEDCFSSDSIKWTAKNSSTVTKVRSLFLYERDNEQLWNRIEQIMSTWGQGLCKETKSFALGHLLTTVISVQVNLLNKVTLMDDFLYWFNSIVTKLHGKTVKARLMDIFNENYFGDRDILTSVQNALLQLHSLRLQSDETDFGSYFLPLYKSFDRNFVDGLLELIAESTLVDISSDNLQDWMVSYDTWKAKERLLWHDVMADDELSLKIVKQIETLILKRALSIFEDRFTGCIMESPSTFEQLAILMCQNSEVSNMFKASCEKVLLDYHKTIISLDTSPLVTAALLCEFAQATMLSSIGTFADFGSHWLKLVNENIELAKPLAQLAATDMSKQTYARVHVIGELIEIICDETALPFDDELSPFLESFGKHLWRAVAEMSWSQPQKDRASRYIHGINLLRMKAPEVVWKTVVYLRQLDKRSNDFIFNPEYWPFEIKQKLEADEAQELIEDYNNKFKHRHLNWDMARSYCDIRLENREITCSFTEYVILDSLVKKPCHSARYDELPVPSSLLDNALKHLISEQIVLYVPSSRQKKFQIDDMIYLAYN